ncbi:MAG: hypothetical protein M0P38_08925 [Bacteroidales bacterium]|nr:hypothetical protein [Bacteroidales bacterium]
MKRPNHSNKTASPPKQRMCVGNAETRCGRAVNDVLFTAVSKGAQRSGSDRLPPMFTKYQSGERSFRLYFLLVRFLCTSKENEQQKIPNQFPFLRILTNNPKNHPDYLGSASWVTDTNSIGIPTFKIYLTKTRGYIEYNRNSTIDDFPHPVINLPEIKIVAPR